jgi:hypothetical protein
MASCVTAIIRFLLISMKMMAPGRMARKSKPMKRTGLRVSPPKICRICVPGGRNGWARSISRCFVLFVCDGGACDTGSVVCFPSSVTLSVHATPSQYRNW